MSLSRGFLRTCPSFKQRSLVRAVFLWVLCSYVFYAFFQLYREVFRRLTAHQGDQVLLVLSPIENHLYNVFMAAIASALGHSIALRFTLQNEIPRTSWKALHLSRRILSNEGYWTWSFLLWFAKVGSMLCIWYMVIAMQYEMNFIQDFAVLLILLPLVLFYSSWPSFTRLIQVNKSTWLLGLTGIFLAMSFGFAFQNFTDYRKINQKQLSQSITHVYDLQPPRSQSHERTFKRSLVVDLFLVRDTVDHDKTHLFVENIRRPIQLRDLRREITLEKDKLSEGERDRLLINLHADERIQLKQIATVTDELRKIPLRRVQYSTARKYSRYPATYPGWKYAGIQRPLWTYYPKFEQFLDSAETMDLTGMQFKLSESQMYRHAFIRKTNRIAIKVRRDSMFLNSQKVDSTKLEETVYQFIKKYTPNYVLVFDPAEDITYGKYIEVLDMLETQVERLREEMSYELFDQPHDPWNDAMDTIRSHYPSNIVQWSTEERRLNNLLKEYGSSY